MDSAELHSGNTFPTVQSQNVIIPSLEKSTVKTVSKNPRLS